MKVRQQFWCLFVLVFALFAVFGTVQAARVQKNMLGSKLAQIELKSKPDLAEIDQAGGIIDNVKGDMAEVYLLPEDFDALQARGFSLHWIRDVKTEFMQELWQRTRDSRNPLDDYHTNDEIQSQFDAWQTQYPNLFHYESIGLSVQGRNLWVCKISNNVNSDDPKIEVKYISTMHGNKPVGTENCMNFAQELLANYQTDPELGDFMNNFAIYLIPLMNPDGNANGVRWNANGIDLNRDFPDRIQDSVNTVAGRQIEVAEVMNWSAQHNFILSANFHTGSVVCNYPWDGNTSGQYVYTACPEDALFRRLALTYSQYNSPMYNSSSFPQGITNGADWYVIYGGMQDWNYVWMGDREITIELDTGQPPDTTQLPRLWQDNRLSMRRFLRLAKYGVHGVVSDSLTGVPLRANIQLSNFPYLTYSDSLHGQYYRVLLAGTYSLTFSAPGYVARTVSATVVNDTIATVLNVALLRAPAPIISTNPAAISEEVPICDSLDIPFTVVNSGNLALNWSAVEGYSNHNGYGSAVGGGWRFMDSFQPDGPTYNWVDISIRGTAITFSTDDQNLGPYTFGFSFPFYGQNFNSFRISSNGWISFTSIVTNASSYTNLNLPDPGAPENIIAPWWDDLSAQRAGTVVRRFSNADSLIVSYNNVQSYQGGGVYNFEIILLRTGKIIFQYGSMGTARLNSSTIGFQNSTKDKGTTFVANDGAYIHNNMAIVFTPTSMVDLIPSSGSVAASSSVNVIARLRSCAVPTAMTNGILAISSNDPVTPILQVPVTLNVNNLPPDTVSNLTVMNEANDIRLRWNSAAHAQFYNVYRDADLPLDPLPQYLIASVSDTTFVDTTALTQRQFYVVTAGR